MLLAAAAVEVTDNVPAEIVEAPKSIAVVSTRVTLPAVEVENTAPPKLLLPLFRVMFPDALSEAVPVPFTVIASL